MFDLLPKSRTRDGIAYHQTGDGPALVLIHGVGLTAECWGNQLQRLKSRYTVFTLDLPGHGGSEMLGTAEPDVRDFTQAIRQAIEELMSEPPVIVGHSLGALISTELASMPDFNSRSIVAISTIHDRSDAALNAVTERAEYIRDNPDLDLAIGPVSRWFDDINSSEALHCRRMIESNSPAGYAAAYRAFAHTRGADVRAIDIPALFLTGEIDRNSTPAMSKALAQIAPLGHPHTVKEAGHMVQLSHPEDTNAAIEAFLKKSHT